MDLPISQARLRTKLRHSCFQQQTEFPNLTAELGDRSVESGERDQFSLDSEAASIQDLQAHVFPNYPLYTVPS